MKEKKVYKIGDRIAFDGCGPDGFTTDYGKVIFVSDYHVIVQINYRGPFAASEFNRIGLPYEIVKGIIGSDVPYNEYDQFVDMYDEISLEYHNMTIENDCLDDNVYDVLFTKEGNYYYYNIVDSVDIKDVDSPNWIQISNLSIDNDFNNLICVEINGQSPVVPIHTWGEVISSFGKQITYALKRDGSFVRDEDTYGDDPEKYTLIQVFKPFRK